MPHGCFGPCDYSYLGRAHQTTVDPWPLTWQPPWRGPRIYDCAPNCGGHVVPPLVSTRRSRRRYTSRAPHKRVEFPVAPSTLESSPSSLVSIRWRQRGSPYPRRVKVPPRQREQTLRQGGRMVVLRGVGSTEAESVVEVVAATTVGALLVGCRPPLRWEMVKLQR
jgi:hypothetical protein